MTLEEYAVRDYANVPATEKSASPFYETDLELVLRQAKAFKTAPGEFDGTR
jgi:hypothetical protein